MCPYTKEVNGRKEYAEALSLKQGVRHGGDSSQEETTRRKADEKRAPPKKSFHRGEWGTRRRGLENRNRKSAYRYIPGGLFLTSFSPRKVRKSNYLGGQPGSGGDRCPLVMLFREGRRPKKRRKEVWAHFSSEEAPASRGGTLAKRGRWRAGGKMQKGDHASRGSMRDETTVYEG